jgi:hypothetical protein
VYTGKLRIIKCDRNGALDGLGLKLTLGKIGRVRLSHVGFFAGFAGVFFLLYVTD